MQNFTLFLRHPNVDVLSFNVKIIYITFMTNEMKSVSCKNEVEKKLEKRIAIAFVFKLVEMDKYRTSNRECRKKHSKNYNGKWISIEKNSNKTQRSAYLTRMHMQKKSDCPRSEERPSYSGVHGNVNALSPQLFMAKFPNVRQMPSYVEKERW